MGDAFQRGDDGRRFVVFHTKMDYTRT
jgi:hypothetical protein